MEWMEPHTQAGGLVLSTQELDFPKGGQGEESERQKESGCISPLSATEGPGSKIIDDDNEECSPRPLLYLGSGLLVADLPWPGIVPSDHRRQSPCGRGPHGLG